MHSLTYPMHIHIHGILTLVRPQESTLAAVSPRHKPTFLRTSYSPAFFLSES